MKHTLTFFILLIFCSCNAGNDQAAPEQNPALADSSKPDKPEKKESFESSTLEYERQQDSLRKEILDDGYSHFRFIL